MEEKKKDWRSMPPGRELDALVGAELGYRIMNINEDPSGTIIKTPFTWMLLRPDEPFDYEYARRTSYTRHHSTMVGAAALLPEYSTDANAALDLWDDDPRWSVRPTSVIDLRDEFSFCASYPMGSYRSAGEEFADTIPHAISKAFMARQDWKRSQRK